MESVPVKRLALFVVGIWSLFAVMISLYHMSVPGWLQINNAGWDTIWASSETGLSLFLCVLILILLKERQLDYKSRYNYRLTRRFFFIVVIPYYSIKFFYTLICYRGIYLFSSDHWKMIWGVICVLVLLASLIFYLFILIRRENAS